MTKCCHIEQDLFGEDTEISEVLLSEQEQSLFELHPTKPVCLGSDDYDYDEHLLLKTLEWKDIDTTKLQQISQKVQSWMRSPIYEADDCLAPYLPCKYLNKSIAMLFIWKHIRGHVKQNKVYDIPLVADGVPVEELADVLHTKFTLATAIPRMDQLSMMKHYYMLASDMQHPDWDFGPMEDLTQLLE